MKRKLLSVAMAAVMTVACLTGCSGSGDFSKSSFISAARKNGMEELKETTKLSHILAEPGETIAFYYDMENMQLFEYSGKPLAEYVSINDIQECVMAVESIGETDDHGTCLTRVFYLTVKDSDTAEEIYESAIKPLRFGAEEGKKDGVTYTISYQGPKDSQNDGSTVELACGVYLMDNHIVWIRSDYYATVKNKAVENFCKSLGLVSPYTLS